MKIHLTDQDWNLVISAYVQVPHLHIPIQFSPFMGKNLTRKNKMYVPVFFKFTVVLYR